MKKAIGSKINLYDVNNPNAMEFMMYVSDLLENDKVQKLADYSQHFNTTRLDHSINVAYYSFRIAKIIGADPRQATRAGLLHDFYWYDWHDKKPPENHALFHPRLAVKNAERITNLTKIEKNAIDSHMWPLSRRMPRYKESYAVTIADKYAATLEIIKQRTKKYRLLFRRN